MQPFTLDDLSSCAVTTPVGPNMRHVLLISFWGGHMTASVMGMTLDSRGQASLRRVSCPACPVFEIVAVWSVLLLYYTGLLPALTPTLKRRPSPLIPPQVQWIQGAFFRGSQDPRGS